MHVSAILNKLLDSATHKTRIKSLIPIIEAAIKIKQLVLTKMGRSLEISGQERAGIRRMDRLLSNPFYQNHSIDVYSQITSYVIGSKKQPEIIVDWTGLPNSRRKTKEGEQCALRATVAAEGRGITIYQEVHPKKKENNQKIHTIFLENLKSILPSGCCPIIVTDAGFKNPWMEAISSLGWDYISRVRGELTYDDGTGFKSIKTLFSSTSNTAKSLGKMVLTKSRPMETNFYIFRHKLKGRKKLTPAGRMDNTKDSKMIARGYREPWILVSSLSGPFVEKRVIKIYKRRMTIEENIRDTKSRTTGLSLNDNLTIQSKRYVVWLLIADLANFVAWVVGYIAEKMNLHYAFQANTYRHVRVLSFFYLGCQIIRKKIPIPIDFNIIYDGIWSAQNG